MYLINSKVINSKTVSGSAQNYNLWCFQTPPEQYSSREPTAYCRQRSARHSPAARCQFTTSRRCQPPLSARPLPVANRSRSQPPVSRLQHVGRQLRTARSCARPTHYASATVLATVHTRVVVENTGHTTCPKGSRRHRHRWRSDISAEAAVLASRFQSSDLPQMQSASFDCLINEVIETSTAEETRCKVDRP